MLTHPQFDPIAIDLHRFAGAAAKQRVRYRSGAGAGVLSGRVTVGCM